MKSILPIVLMTFSVSAYSQNKISYQYDAAGNRIRREILFSQSQMSKKQNNINTDMLGEHKITISPNPTEGLLRVEILDGGDAIDGEAIVYSANGSLVASAPLKSSVTELNIGSCPSGIYLLHIKQGNSKLVWKIIKK